MCPDVLGMARAAASEPVIRVTRLYGSVFFVNAEMIEFVEATPDTVITLTDGAKLLVRETADAVVHAILVYRQQTHQPPFAADGH